MTFGLASPPLALIIGAYLISQTILWQILLGRYLELHPNGIRYKDAKQGFRKDLTLGGSVDCSGGLEECCADVWKGPIYSLKLVLLSSALFLGIIILDLLEDEATLANAAWAPLLILAMALCLLAVNYAFFSTEREHVLSCRHKLHGAHDDHHKFKRELDPEDSSDCKDFTDVKVVETFAIGENINIGASVPTSVPTVPAFNYRNFIQNEDNFYL